MRLLIPKRDTLIVPKRYAAPMAPAAFVDATEEWARKSGRHVRWTWSAEMECFVINLSMSPNAPAMREWQEGRLQQADPPAEGFPLMEQDPKTGKFRALDLEQYGPSGIVNLLEQADLWSGRGEHDSLPSLISKVVERNRATTEKLRQDKRQLIWDRAHERRRQVLGIPFLPVGIDLRTKTRSRAKRRSATKE